MNTITKDLFMSRIFTGPNQIGDPHYNISVTVDTNDADYVTNSFSLSENDFRDLDLDVLLMLSYCSKNWAAAKESKFYDKDGSYGDSVIHNKDFDWIVACIEEALSGDAYDEWGGMVFPRSEWDTRAHSVDEIKVEYVDRSGICHDVTLPDFDELFAGYSKEEMVKIVNEIHAKCFAERQEKQA